MTRIYALIDPRNDKVRYIGKTTMTLKMRLNMHIYKAKSCKLHRRVFTWIRILLNLNLRPLIKEIDQCLNNGSELERKWIAEYNINGTPLLNSVAGGGGATRSHIISLTPEIKRRLGVDSDAAIADDLGVTRKAISYWRVKLGIPSTKIRLRARAPRNCSPRIYDYTPILHLLGTKPDIEIARIIGCSKVQINKLRRRLNIKCSDPRHKYKPVTPVKMRIGKRNV